MYIFILGYLVSSLALEVTNQEKNFEIFFLVFSFFSSIRLPGESQQIERIVEAFSAKYSADLSNNKIEIEDKKTVNNDPESMTEDDVIHVQPDADSVFVLSYSIIMLNTDFHNPQVREHMSFDDYSNNLRGCYNGKDFPHW